ncbi:hypothetical protein TNCV_2237671 [Trichonephila clavipes]|nr:hypothetical protein TNCV_2237671 [Trichonephila clavipes]
MVQKQQLSEETPAKSFLVCVRLRRCRRWEMEREAHPISNIVDTLGKSEPAPVNRLVISSVSPERHSCRVSAADKGCRVYTLDPRPDVVILYSRCTLDKRRAWFLLDDGHTGSLVGLRVITLSESHSPIPLCTTVPSTSNCLLNSAALSSPNQTPSSSICPMFSAFSNVTSPSVPESLPLQPIAYHLQLHLLYPRLQNL